MALSARVPSTAVTNLFVPKLYAQRVIDATHNQLVAWDAITSEWRNDLVKGNILYITKTNTVTATEVVVGTKASSLNPFNTTGITLTIDQWYEAPVDIDDMTMKQSHIDMDTYASKEASYSVSKKMDSTVCDLFSSLGGYSTSAYGADGQTLTDDILVYLVETLLESDVPQDGTWSIIGDPSSLADMLKIDKYLTADYISKKGAIEHGIIGHTIYGGVLRVTNNLTAATTGSYGVMLHPKAIASAAQIDTTWREVYPELHETRYQAEALWGVIEAQDAFGIPFFTRKK